MPVTIETTETECLNDGSLSQENQRRSSSWPLWLFVMSLMLINFGLLPWIHQIVNNTLLPGWIETCLLGCTVGIAGGQLGFASIVGGLWGRTWLAGILTASAIANMCLESYLIGAWFADRRAFDRRHAQIFAMPMIILFTSVPLVVCRFAFGWKLARPGTQHPPRGQSGVEDLFLATAAIASILCLFQISSNIAEVKQSLVSLAVLLVPAVANLVGTCPAIYLAFRIKRRRQRWLCLSGLGLVFVSAFTGIFAWISYLRNVPFWNDTLTMSLVGSASAVLVLLIALGSLRACGLQLDHNESQPVHQASNPETGFRNSARKQQRWCAAGLLLLTLLSSVFLMAMESHRRALDEDHVALDARLREQGGSIRVQSRQIYGLKLGREAIDQSLEEFRQFTTINSIDLTGTRVTDAVIPTLLGFPWLSTVKLSHTNLSESALMQLAQVEKLHTLSLAGTQIQIAQVPELVARMNLWSLDLSELAIDDSDLLQHVLLVAPRMRTQGTLHLQRNKITDAGLKAFLNRSKSSFGLDLSGNLLDGSGLDQPLSLYELILNDVPLTDAVFGQAISKFAITYRLSLSNTRLTDSFLTKLGPTPAMHLEFGDGNFTEQGLAASGLKVIPALGLIGKQFTGRCFEQWHPRIEHLNMSRSGVTDDSIAFINNVVGVLTISLAHTPITDRGLKELFSKRSMSKVSTIDLGYTQVSADGILSANLPKNCTVRIAVGQFTVDEQKKLKNRLQVN